MAGGEVGRQAAEEYRQRLLAWEGCLNARDLGGYPTGDGRATRWRALVRADNLAALTEAGRAAVVAYGIRSVIDLRRPHEVAQSPGPFAGGGVHPIAYANVSFGDPAVAPPTGDTLAGTYRCALDRFAHRIAAIMRTIAQAPTGGVVVYCNAGKDRTGIIAALLLELAGVTRETIGADYALSAAYLRARDEAGPVLGPSERAARDRLRAERLPRPEVIQDVLGYLDETYGGTEGYLREAGVPADDIIRLRARLLPGAPQRKPAVPDTR